MQSPAIRNEKLITMILDTLFYTEKKLARKIAMLVTIPCAILPILVATAGIMSIPFSPLFFHHDYLLFGGIYAVYFFGLFLSWQTHKKWISFALFLVHLSSVFVFIFDDQAEWLAYVSITSIMATSISNQYFRIGSVACDKECGL